jgi:hypothetical protein
MPQDNTKSVIYPQPNRQLHIITVNVSSMRTPRNPYDYLSGGGNPAGFLVFVEPIRAGAIRAEYAHISGARDSGELQRQAVVQLSVREFRRVRQNRSVNCIR